MQVNSYQAIIITDHTSQTYAVFTYKCGDLNWARSPTIGFNAASLFYENYDLSGSTSADIMDCFNSPTNDYFNLVYNVSAKDFVPPPPLPTYEPRKYREKTTMNLYTYNVVVLKMHIMWCNPSN